jgi:uncharacterized membrane protein (UPF0127 family)
MACVLVNERTQETVATAVELAATRQSRRRGLLGRDHLHASAAMMLVPCAAVHTAFMRFPIDVVVVDRQGVALKVITDVRPWSIVGAIRGRAVIEMAAGTLKGHQVRLGDRLTLLSGDHHDA